MVENVQLITWRVDNLTHYDIKPYCFMNMKTQCSNNLPVIVYKRPDRVSISTVDHTGPMIEGGQYELRCDVQNVAPVRLLTVNWYKGHHLVERESLSGEDKFPVNVNVTLQISPSKDDDGVQYRCVAELNLGPEGPQHPPIVTSDPLNITVHYKPEMDCLDWSPIINTPLSSYPYNVVGNPTPHITWHRDELLISSDVILSKNYSGRYTFFASNLIGNASCVISITVESQSSQCPDLVLDPPELVVRYGDPVSVSCRSLSEYTDLGWDVSLGSVSLLDNQTVIWKTDNLTDWEIVPVCYMILNGVQCRRTLPLTVYKLPDEVSFSIVNHVGPMIEGKKYELQCKVYNFAPVNVLAAFWYKGEKLLKNRGFAELPTKTPSNRTVSHKITAGRDEGEAQYWCEAKLKLGPAGPQPSPTIKSNLLKVAVHYKPVIKPCSDWSPMIHTPLSSFPYNVTGNPTPHITWHRDKSPVSSDMILSGNDSGTYELLANNNMGRASCVIKITVEYAPTFRCPAIYEGQEHDSFLDKCLVMASPVANISWEKDGKMVNPLYNLTREDSGTHVITAVNKHGVEKHSLTVNVLYGPEIEPDYSSHVMQKGEAVSLSCTAGGNPEPEVTWRFQSQTKATGRRQTTLTISEATFADDGVYTCTAMNDLGNDRRTVTVHVEGDCPVKILPVKLVREFGASASANCFTTIIHHGMGWEASQGAVDMVENVQLITWRVDNLTHYDIKPYCFMNMKTQCSNNLPVIVYKRPDRVSISTVDHTGPMIEGGQYELRCDVQNVAPVRLLTVNWYKGHHLVERESLSGEDKFPVNVNVKLQISPSKDDDGVQYRCVAELNLGPEGPQHPPIVTSDPLNITVHCECYIEF
ncbi:hemicentin-1-like [Clarias gariepinus]|uniref:hemicentin-1-like n=1 Tax=Clarias gariepinus TaxID=13013 RepID=UPI00234CE296|nr:hemicentin-1-like [Clarias gariepinus]